MNSVPHSWGNLAGTWWFTHSQQVSLPSSLHMHLGSKGPKNELPKFSDWWSSHFLEADVDFGAWAAHHAPPFRSTSPRFCWRFKIWIHRNTLHRILWSSQRSGMESQFCCQDLRNSTEWNLPAYGFKKSAHLSQEKLAHSKWKSLMFLFIWHIIPLGYEVALLQAATNDVLTSDAQTCERFIMSSHQHWRTQGGQEAWSCCLGFSSATDCAFYTSLFFLWGSVSPGPTRA